MSKWASRGDVSVLLSYKIQNVNLDGCVYVCVLKCVCVCVCVCVCGGGGGEGGVLKSKEDGRLV